MKKNKNLTATFQKQLNLPNDGDGINQYMLSLRETLQDLTRLQDTDFLCVSPISPSRSKKTKSNKDS